MAGEEIEEGRERLIEQVAMAEGQSAEVGGEQRILALRDLEGRRHGHDRACDSSGNLVAEKAEDLSGDFGGRATAGFRLWVEPADAHLVLGFGQVVGVRPQAEFDGTRKAASRPFADELTVGKMADDRGHEDRGEVSAERRLGDFEALRQGNLVGLRR